MPETEIEELPPMTEQEMSDYLTSTGKFNIHLISESQKQKLKLIQERKKGRTLV